MSGAKMIWSSGTDDSMSEIRLEASICGDADVPGMPFFVTISEDGDITALQWLTAKSAKSLHRALGLMISELELEESCNG